ncbi:MAG: long-chain fatty acid--CoA ligase [Pirellulales bacterium]|nr:long-chain fatty acid--CoA ligase [Pirellulales bacterium]
MHGLIMDYQLTLPAILRRAEQLFAAREVVSRLPDRSSHRYTYADMVRRTKRLSLALNKLGIERGDRVATFCWNHYQHLEAYFGIPCCGGVLHTLNLRLHHDDLAYIAGHAEDKIVIVDDVLWPLFAPFRDRVPFQQVIVVRHGNDHLPPGTIDYEELLDSVHERDFVYPDFDERQAAAMCYTSGTTGRPKGVLYSHRAIALHSLAAATVDVLGLREADTVLPVVPMFHANAWGIPFGCLLVGAKQVFPGPHLDPRLLLEQLSAEQVTMTAGVPTIWLGMLQILDQESGRYDLSRLRAMIVGGSAAPRSMIRAFEERHGLNVVHAWGMTELAPMGTVANLPQHLLEAPLDAQLDYRAKQGKPAPFVEVRGRNENGEIAWDGQSMGELECRGAWIANAYYNSPEGAASFTPDDWFRTGDIVAIDPDGCVHLQDRAKDVIKSGGEWISSVALENALMGHDAVAEAAVVPVMHPKWAERPLAVVVLKQGRLATQEELIDFLRPQFAKWWLPDAVEFVESIPRTSAGKFQKSKLREQFQNYYCQVG